MRVCFCVGVSVGVRACGCGCACGRGWVFVCVSLCERMNKNKEQSTDKLLSLFFRQKFCFAIG